ncbi:UNVERIFIED_CONTAM: hypothetical protein LK11_09910 [Mumia flava]
MVEALRMGGETVALAESLTGGLLTGRLVDVAGASDVVRGGIVAYATDLKASLLGVDADLLARAGPVDAGVAEQMATGVRDRLGATYGLATTGVAGPGPADGAEAGTVFLGIATPSATESVALRLDGDRSQVRALAVESALELLMRHLIDD